MVERTHYLLLAVAIHPIKTRPDDVVQARDNGDPSQSIGLSVLTNECSELLEIFQRIIGSK